jgi:hypothetical protein
MDIWVAIHPENAERIVTALEEFGFNLPEVHVDLFLEQDKIVRMGVPPISLEILTTISGVDFEDCYRNRIETEIDGVKVSLISLTDLKRNKLASGRHKDLNDLENLP